MQKQFRLIEIIEDLLKIDDKVWGLYAFSRDILKERIPEDKKIDMIKSAIDCGREYAQRIIMEYETADVNAIANKLKLNIILQDEKITGKRILFACCTPPDEITIMTEPVNKAAQLILMDETKLFEYLKKDSIMNIILGHEIFHCIEDKYEQEIYTRTEKILLWNFLGFKNYSTIRALSEIGAMAFTKELNGLKFSPFILDILLYYSYDSSSAEKIYHDILEMN